jgi:hypothetical protein
MLYSKSTRLPNNCFIYILEIIWFKSYCMKIHNKQESFIKVKYKDTNIKTHIQMDA